MMNIAEVLRAIHEEDTLPAVQIEWEQSQAAFPQAGIDFLRPDVLSEAMLYCGFEPDQLPPLLAFAARVQADPCLAALIWHAAWRTYESDDEHWFGGWPRLEKALGIESGLFFLLVGLAMIPRVRRLHASWGIPDEVTRETCRQNQSYSLNYAAATEGGLGIPIGQLFWLRHYTREPYFRLGRYEFWLKRLDWDIRVYRHKTRGCVLALAPDDMRYDAQGYCPVDSLPDQPGDWRTTLVESEGRLRAYPISPLGVVVREPVELILDEWTPALTTHDWVLDMHIPAGGGMSAEAVHASMRRAAEFFPKFFPDRPAKAFVCWSWIYNPGLAEFLPAESNLVRNLSDAYLVPVESHPGDGLGFIFYQETFDARTAPRKTSLQRAVLDYLERGGIFRSGGMFYLLEDLDRLGTAVYRTPDCFSRSAGSG